MPQIDYGSVREAAEGYRADMVAFDAPDMRVLETWVAGVGTETHAREPAQA